VADTLAVEYYYEAIATRFAAEGTPVTCVFGWRTPAQHPEGNRIAWVPGDPSGKMGELAPARQPGRDPRPIATLRELFTLYLDAVDTDDVENETLQYRAVRLLFDAWLRAMYLAAHGNFQIRSVDWLSDGTLERRYGATARVVVAVDSMVPDEPAALAPVDVGALIALSEQDVTESIEVTP
jgi:hypothetical protein